MRTVFQEASKGKPGAARAVIERLRPRLASMAAYYARCSGEDADDLLQEAWVGLLEALPDLDVRIGSPEHYLVQRGRWRLLDAVKRAKVRRCLPLDEDALPPVFCRAYESAAAREWISGFMSRLTRKQRLVAECLMAGLTWREAGRALGCSSANIAYHVRQIRKAYDVYADELSLPPREVV